VYNVVDPATVPIEVQQANAELALNAASEDLNPVRTQGIISKEVGPLKVVYDPNSPSGKQYSKIGMILLPLLDVGANGANVKLRRV
jgi:flagellar basal body rod protein FlgC